MKVVIFAAGEYPERAETLALTEGAGCMIGADGGARVALELGLVPDLAIGDFDSGGDELAAELEARSVPVRRLPRAKDETDTHAALAEALRRGATELVLLGASGSRLDHTLANLLLLPALPPDIRVTLAGGRNLVRLVRPGMPVTVPAQAGAYLSLLPLSPEVTGVTAQGVRWPLADATLRWGESLGVSNEITAENAEIQVRTGYMLAIRARD